MPHSPECQPILLRTTRLELEGRRWDTADLDAKWAGEFVKAADFVRFAHADATRR
jgi:hypothetical protein